MGNHPAFLFCLKANLPLAILGEIANIGRNFSGDSFMRRLILGLFAVLTLSACASQVAEFWRPISEPNTIMPLNQAQMKLNFDLSQCSCGIFRPTFLNLNWSLFQPDQQRFAETSITRTILDDEDDGTCMQRPSLVVAECMRTRGWEVTNCSGRMPMAGGGARSARPMWLSSDDPSLRARRDGANMGTREQVPRLV
jgi:hypothetical protein